MRSSPLVVQKQTIKQAKAAYKARSRPTISEQEQRQLQRAIDLDRRAWGLKEREKRKNDALKKRQEKERREQEERAKVQLGTQRRCDKFGYKSSQMHLDAFFGGGGVPTKQTVAVEEDDGFGDDGVDDDSLLEVLESPRGAGRDYEEARPQQSMLSPLAPKKTSIVPRAQTEPSPITSTDFSSFLDELGSSTQIARELDDDDHELKTPTNVPKTTNHSFEAGDFDITAEDLEELAPVKSALTTKLSDRALMPPPALPSKARAASFAKPTPLQQATKAPLVRAQDPYTPVQTIVTGFTMAELEGFVDDDLQLTQVAPG